jgi:ketosteroid isomerase-like protein
VPWDRQPEGQSEILRAMSQENVEIVRAAIDAYNRGDWDAVVKDAASDFEFDLSRAVGPNHGVYGRDQTQSFSSQFAEDWESVWIEPHEFVEADEHVVVPWTMHAVGRDGIEVQTRVTFTWTIRNGAIERVCMYQGLPEALEAAGLRE